MLALGPSQLYPLFPRCREAGVDSVPDEIALKFTHRLQDIELELPARVVAGGINTLRAAYERDIEPGHLIDQQTKMGDAAAQPVELVGHHALHSTLAQVFHQPVQLRPGSLLARNLVHVILGVLPASQPAMLLQFSKLGIGALLFSGYPDVCGGNSVHENKCYSEQTNGQVKPSKLLGI